MIISNNGQTKNCYMMYIFSVPIFIYIISLLQIKLFAQSQKGRVLYE